MLLEHFCSIHKWSCHQWALKSLKLPASEMNIIIVMWLQISSIDFLETTGIGVAVDIHTEYDVHYPILNIFLTIRTTIPTKRIEHQSSDLFVGYIP